MGQNNVDGGYSELYGYHKLHPTRNTILKTYEIQPEEQVSFENLLQRYKQLDSALFIRIMSSSKSVSTPLVYTLELEHVGPTLEQEISFKHMQRQRYTELEIYSLIESLASSLLICRHFTLPIKHISPKTIVRRENKEYCIGLQILFNYQPQQIQKQYLSPQEMSHLHQQNEGKINLYKSALFSIGLTTLAAISPNKETRKVELISEVYSKRLEELIRAMVHRKNEERIEIEALFQEVTDYIQWHKSRRTGLSRGYNCLNQRNFFPHHFGDTP